MPSYRQLAAFSVLSAFFVSAAGATTPLEDRVPLFGSLNAGEWSYYSIQTKDWQAEAGMAIKNLDSGNADLYVRRGALPTLSAWDFRSATDNLYEIVRVNATTVPALQSDTYYIGVYGRSAAAYGVAADRFELPAAHPGMGAIPYADGVTFRVWAPNADQVYVAGQFNNWSATKAALQAEGGGNWSLDYRNARAGQEYKFVLHNGGSTLWKTDARSLDVTNSTGNSVVFDPTQFDWGGQARAEFSMPQWNELVIYELHVGTFNDSPGGMPGDFYSAINRLGQLQDLGVNAVEVMPICEFSGDYSWGYNPAQPYAVETAYGGPGGYQSFVKAAHEHGIAVFQDLVFNHFGPSDLELWRYDGWGINGGGGIFFYNDYRKSTPWGDTRPDYGRGEVRQYLRDNALMWLETFHADGLRFDGTAWIRKVDGFGEDIPDGWSLMQWINDEVDAHQGWKYVIAEDMRQNEWITKPTSVGGAGYDGQWDPDFVHPVREAIITPDDNSRNMYSLAAAITHRYNNDAFERVIYTESHDEVANGRSRVPEEIWPGNAGSWYSRKRSTLGAALVMTAPGVPMLFQGQEVLEDGYFDDDDPVDWSKRVTYAGIESLYRDLIHLRRNWYNNTRGLRGQNVNVHHINNSDKMIAFHRWDQGGPSPGDDTIVVVNCADRSWNDYLIGFPAGGTWQVRFNSDSRFYSTDFGDFGSTAVQANAGWRDGMAYTGSVAIAPYSVLILSQ